GRTFHCEATPLRDSRCRRPWLHAQQVGTRATMTPTCSRRRPPAKVGLFLPLSLFEREKKFSRSPPRSPPPSASEAPRQPTTAASSWAQRQADGAAAQSGTLCRALPRSLPISSRDDRSPRTAQSPGRDRFPAALSCNTG